MRCGRQPRRFAASGACCALAALVCAAGCKSDLNQQLLERELRYQEDQIYQLQDELQAACARIERATSENVSLKRQLGVSDGDSATPRRGSVRPRAGLPAPVTVPPALEIPDMPAAPGGPPTGPLEPPALEGVPPLPGAPPPPARTSAVPPAATDGDLSLPPPADAGPVRRLSHEELAADAGRATHLVVNAAQTSCLDTDGDGTSDGLSVVFEPRDADERLVAMGRASPSSCPGRAARRPATTSAWPSAWPRPTERPSRPTPPWPRGSPRVASRGVKHPARSTSAGQAG